MATITIDPNYGYVIIVAASSFLLGGAHTANTGIYRGKAKVTYPLAYAPADRTDPEAHQFNCAQRSHANYIENQVQAIGALLLAGLKYPLVSAVLGAIWVVSRSSYMFGYSKGDVGGKGRYKRGGSIFWFPQVGLVGIALWTGLSLALGL